MNCLFSPIQSATGLHLGDCRDVLRGIPDNSIDSIVTDPPYALVSIVKRFGGENAAPAKGNDAYARASAGFMGKQWDTGEVAFSEEFWQEVYRVLKPGGHVVSFGGTRTYHRMACAIEDAGFEIRDQLQWLYGTGFPKSHNVYKNLVESGNISEPIDKSEIDAILEAWKNLSSFAKLATNQSQKNRTAVGINIVENGSVPENALLTINLEKYPFLAPIAESVLREVHLTSTKGIISAQSNAEVFIPVLNSRVKHAEKSSEDLNLMLSDTLVSSAPRDVRASQKENTEHNPKVAEALKTWLGKRKYSSEEITHALCAALTEDLKLTILNQSKIFQSLDTKSQTDFVCATTVTITESMAANRISSMVDILKSEAEQWEGWGTSLKPANEPICLARKPLSEKTVALNVLKWGTGALNIDACRIEAGEDHVRNCARSNVSGIWREHGSVQGVRTEASPLGRFPANVITDGSVEMPNGAQRFFYSAKASKADRGEGNSHPTVKPTSLMQWLCRLVTPPGGVVLDPFMGSGSTGKAAHLEGFKFVGIEREEEYFEIAKRRVT